MRSEVCLKLDLAGAINRVYLRVPEIHDLRQLANKDPVRSVAFSATGGIFVQSQQSRQLLRTPLQLAA